MTLPGPCRECNLAWNNPLLLLVTFLPCSPSYKNISHYININRNFAWIIDSDRCSNSSSDKKYQSSNAIVKKLKNQDIFAWASPYREFENHIDSSLFLEALKHVQRKEKAELLYDDIYSDRFWLKINEKNNSPKINVKLTPKLHDLIKRNKNKIGNIDPNIIKEELQKRGNTPLT